MNRYDEALSLDDVIEAEEDVVIEEEEEEEEDDSQSDNEKVSSDPITEEDSTLEVQTEE